MRPGDKITGQRPSTLIHKVKINKEHTMSVTLVKISDTVTTSTPCPVNVPCPSAGHTFTPLRTIAGRPVRKSTDAPDYSDGYGSTYAVGE